MSESVEVELSLGDVIEKEPLDPETGEWHSRPDYVSVYALQGPVEPLRLSISHRGEDDVYFAPDEAQQLVAAVGSLLGKAGR